MVTFQCVQVPVLDAGTVVLRKVASLNLPRVDPLWSVASQFTEVTSIMRDIAQGDLFLILLISHALLAPIHTPPHLV